MGLKRKLIIAVLALGSFAVVSGFGAAPAGAATPDNLISTAQYDQLWAGMTEPALEAFLGKHLTVVDWGTYQYPGGPQVNGQVWAWEATFGECTQDTYFLFLDGDYNGTRHDMQLADWTQDQSPECSGIVK